MNIKKNSVIIFPTPVEIARVRGSSITMLCLGNRDSSSTAWIYSSTTNLSTSNLAFINKNSNSSQYIVGSDYSLTILNISHINEGYYACVNSSDYTVYTASHLFVEGNFNNYTFKY